MKKILGNIFAIFGVVALLFCAVLIWERNSPYRLAFAVGNTTEIPNQTQTIAPTWIEIPRLNVSLPVFPARLQEGKWPSTAHGVSYLESSALPGLTGNSIFYGHNWTNILGSLSQVNPGDEIIVKLSDQKTVKFTVEFTSIVTPDQTHILSPSSDIRLTLYTCTGFLDSKRFVVTAVPVKA